MLPRSSPRSTSQLRIAASSAYPLVAHPSSDRLERFLADVVKSSLKVETTNHFTDRSSDSLVRVVYTINQLGYWLAVLS